ncbi:MAG: DNA mismatch repair protein MutT, partial [Candidatus Magasanikbacteria bacterium]|nr:DNA mismatch repair protein MutT [Candidatus Magasanikbacteria bacterium]
LEEAGIDIKNVRIAKITNDVFEKEQKHYVTIVMVAEYDKGELQMMEPEKWEAWDWFHWDALPSPLFLPIQNLLKQDFNPFKVKM